MYEFTYISTTTPCVKHLLILSLVINWKSKRVLNLNPKS